MRVARLRLIAKSITKNPRISSRDGARDLAVRRACGLRRTDRVNWNPLPNQYLNRELSKSGGDDIIFYGR